MKSDTTVELDQERLEGIDGSFDKIDKLMERVQNRLTLNNLAICERYLKGELKLCLIVQWGNHEYRAVFQRKFSVGGRDVDRGELDGFTRLPGHVQLNLKPEMAVRGTDREQEPVFVVDVETMETPKEIIPSVVRLQSADSFYRCWAGSLYASLKFGLHSICASGDGELGPVTGGSSSSLNKLPGKVIQGTPEVVDGVADDRGPAARRVLRDLDAIQFLSSFRLFLGEHAVGLAISEAFDLQFEITDVLLGPFDLFVNPDKAIWHGYSDYERRSDETEDAKGRGHPGSQAQGLPEEPQEGRHAQVSSEQPEEVTPRTSRSVSIL